MGGKRSESFYSLPVHERTKRGREVRKKFVDAVAVIHGRGEVVSYTTLVAELRKPRNYVTHYLDAYKDFANMINLVAEGGHQGPHRLRVKKAKPSKKLPTALIKKYQEAAESLRRQNFPVTYVTLAFHLGIEREESKDFLLNFPDFESASLA